MEILDLTVVKRDGKKEPYMREKIESGIRKAFEKRPLSRDDFHALISGIEQDIQKLGKDEILSKEIGNIVMRKIKSRDQVAYIRFASVYRNFSDVDSFLSEIKMLKARRNRTTKSSVIASAAKQSRQAEIATPLRGSR
jgi:transcriptional repressor NrdR